MRKILVTGAAGFVGRRLVERLAEKDEVFALVRSDGHTPVPNVRWLAQDLSRTEWTVALPAKIDAVVHLAQSPHFRSFPEQAVDMYNVSTGATMRLLDWARSAGARHFVLASTGGIYGFGDTPFQEADALSDDRSQLGFYFATKRTSELIALQYASQFSVTVLRYFFVYGAGQAPQMLMPRLVRSVKEGNPIKLQGEEGIRINPIHVSDAVGAIERCLGLAESRVFNIAGPEVVTLKAVAESIGRLVGRTPAYDVDLTASPRHLIADINRMTRSLGAPTITVDEGLKELIAAGP